MVYSRCLSLGPGQGPGPGRMSCIVLRRTFHTAHEQGHGRMGYVPIFQVLKLFQVVFLNDISMAFRCPVLTPEPASVNGFCIIQVTVQVPLPVPETASVYTPSTSQHSQTKWGHELVHRKYYKIPYSRRHWNLFRQWDFRSHLCPDSR